MLKKGSKLNSILTGTCPKCQNESMYLDKKPFNLKNTLKCMKNAVIVVNLSNRTFFFYGAMYVSYGLNVAYGITTFVISYLILVPHIKTAFIAIIIALIILFPYVLRWARNIYINMFVTYDPNWDKE
jgi:pilus assembly protein TadC